MEGALDHFREAVRYYDAAGNRYFSGATRANTAIALMNRGRLRDARDWAQAALRDYETYGERAAAELAKTRGLLDAIERDLGGGG